VNDQDAFREYVGNSLSSSWHTSDDEMIIDYDGKVGGQYSKQDQNEIVVLLTTHYDRDMDAIVDSYKFNVWVKGVGIGTSQLTVPACVIRVADSIASKSVLIAISWQLGLAVLTAPI